MSSATLEHIIEEVRALTAQEQRKVRDLIESLLQSSAKAQETLSPEDLLEQKLLEDGLISEIPKRDYDPMTYREFEPIEVKGKPVSQTIIEERR